MKGLVFAPTIPRYLLAKAVGRFYPQVHYGAGSCLSLRELPSPSLPGPEWVRLRPLLAGLCGSDIGTLFFKMSLQLEPFNSFPAVLGHEVVAEVVECGPQVRGLEQGQHVAVNPLLPCRLRAISPPCLPCSQGLEQGCLNTAEGCLAPGGLLGYHRDLPGGMGTEMVAHASQLHPLPQGVTDRQGVLVEPLAVAVHAVLRAPPAEGDRVLVIGGGPVAFACLWALRALGYRCHITLLSTESFQLELARRMGADECLRVAAPAAEAEEVARRTGARVYQPSLGPPVLQGGFELTFDCVGSRASVQASLRYTRALGRVVLVGAAGTLERIDWTAVWHSELTLLGSYVYGPESFRGQRRHTFDVVLELLARGEGPDTRPLITHTFPLARYPEAIEANLARSRYQSLKTLFDLTVSP